MGKVNIAILSGIKVIELIPQRHPMVMIDTLLFSDYEKTVTGFTINNSCIFLENGKLSESGIVENIAQTAAAGVGYICKQENKNVPIGFIAAIKNLNIKHLPAEFDEIKTEVKIVNQVMDVTIISGTVFLKNELIADCEMRIFLKSD